MDTNEKDKDNELGFLIFYLLRKRKIIDYEDWHSTISILYPTITIEKMKSFRKDIDNWEVIGFENLNYMAKHKIPTITYAFNTY